MVILLLALQNYLHSDDPELCIEKNRKITDAYYLNFVVFIMKNNNLKVEILFVLQKFYNTYKTLVSLYFAKIK